MMQTPSDMQIGSWTLLGADASQVRTEVFVKEQGIPANLEWDALDADVIHVVIYDQPNQLYQLNQPNSPIATGRLIPPVEPNGIAKIGRMAVLKSSRRQGVGDRVMSVLIAKAAELGYRHIELSSQSYVTEFYAKHGFVAEGPFYEDAGIKHVTMRLTLS